MNILAGRGRGLHNAQIHVSWDWDEERRDSRSLPEAWHHFTLQQLAIPLGSGVGAQIFDVGPGPPRPLAGGSAPLMNPCPFQTREHWD